jgi:hypothetical protein
MYKIIFLLASMFILFSCNQNQQTKVGDTDSAATAINADTASPGKTIPGPVPNTIMTPEYAKSLANSIYLWAWPMMNMHYRKLMYLQVPKPMLTGGILPLGSVNHIAMLTDYIAPSERDVACPNQDVAYGGAPLDLNKDAVIVQVPDFGDRFWVYQVCDQRTDGFASLGKMYNTKPGFYLLAKDDWNGKVPDDIVAVFRSPTAFGMVIPRVFLTDDPADKKAALSLINQINLYPLSEFDGKMKTVDYTLLPKGPAEKKMGKEEKQWVYPETFFDELPAVLQEVKPMPGEEVWYGQMQSLLSAIDKNPNLKSIVKQTAFDAEKNLIKPLFQLGNVGYPVKYYWNTQRNGAMFGTDYLTRTGCARANIFVNKPNESKYFYQDFDSSRTRLSGNGKYTITFAKGELPPVKGFWSLTLYDEYHFFSPNVLNRYSVGTKNKDLKYNDDGSLTLYIQNTAPQGDKKNNWLPAPKDVFCLYFRCYWPEERTLNDEWTPPAVIKGK